MRLVLCLVVFVFVASLSYAGEERKQKNKGEICKEIMPIIEKIKERREEQRKSNMTYFKEEVNKLDISEEAKKKIIERFAQRMEDVKEKRQQHRERKRSKK